MKFTRVLSDMLKQKAQLDIAKSNQKMKQANVNNLQSSIKNLDDNYKVYQEFVNNEDQNLKSTKDEVVNKIKKMTEKQRKEYMENIFNRIESSKVSYSKFIWMVLGCIHLLNTRKYCGNTHEY